MRRYLITIVSTGQEKISELTPTCYDQVGQTSSCLNKIGGRLKHKKHFIHFWERLTSYKFILKTVAGYKIEFKPEALCDHNWSRKPEGNFNPAE